MLDTLLDRLLEILYICFKFIGIHGPVILLIFSIFLLKNKDTLLFYYLVGIFCNVILNLVLKALIKSPRPDEDPDKFELAIKHLNRTFKDGVPFNIFGMPSGHTQNALFSTIFIYFAFRSKKLFFFYLLISFITLCQRVISRDHTLSQVIVGSFIGAFVAYYAYYLAQEKLKGKIRERKDDYGPI
jgi:membrane-associated phospholipid phosphatase